MNEKVNAIFVGVEGAVLVLFVRDNASSMTAIRVKAL